MYVKWLREFCIFLSTRQGLKDAVGKAIPDLTPPQPLPEAGRGLKAPPSLAGKGVGGLGFPTLPTVRYVSLTHHLLDIGALGYR
ncbi:hypothetical protein [Microseira sp. BLCC-F43]|jgi:hypothetical protein|uniref:hypothetical protein n=1 Tax=Microseira sp. BLCC-F43 TaxID=3153602 RepID=UPI0035BAD3C5